MGKVVSICIPIFNQIRFVKDLIHSIKSNQNKKVEFIICDNNSSDGTYEVLLKNKKYFKLFRNKKNVGFLKNFLKTIKKSNSEYITFLGGDDVIYSIKNLLSICTFMKDKDISMGFSPIYLFSEKIKDKKLHFNFKKKIFYDYEDAILNNWLNSVLASFGGWIVKTKELKKINLKKIPSKSIFPTYHIGFQIIYVQKKISAIFSKPFYIQRNGNNPNQLANLQYLSFNNFIEIYKIFTKIKNKKIFYQVKKQFIKVIIKNAVSFKVYNGNIKDLIKFIKKHTINKKLTLFEIMFIRIVQLTPAMVMRFLLLKYRSIKYKNN